MGTYKSSYTGEKIDNTIAKVSNIGTNNMKDNAVVTINVKPAGAAIKSVTIDNGYWILNGTAMFDQDQTNLDYRAISISSNSSPSFPNQCTTQTPACAGTNATSLNLTRFIINSAGTYYFYAKSSGTTTDGTKVAGMLQAIKIADYVEEATTTE